MYLQAKRNLSAARLITAAGRMIVAPFVAAIRLTLELLIRFYQRYLSFLIGPTCRFHPTCSCYALEALRKKPLHVALALIVWRLARCQPFCKGGFDPLPGVDSPAPEDIAAKSENTEMLG